MAQRKRKIYEINFYLTLAIQWAKKERQFSVVLLQFYYRQMRKKKFSQSEEKTTQDKKEPKNCVHLAFLLKPLLIK